MTDPYVPLTGPPTWHHAACRGENPDLWFPISIALGVNRRGETAIDICHRCTLAEQCLEWAVEHREEGIWAGTTAVERNGAAEQRCPQGHLYDTTNTGTGPYGRRRCRRCAVEKKQRADHGTADCLVCGMTYRRRRPEQMYCSRSCSAKANQRPGGRPTLPRQTASDRTALN